MILKDKVAIVTGSSRGIGRAVALEFAKEGANVTVVARSSLEAAEETASQIKKMGREAISVMIDVRSFLQANDMINKTLQEFGRIDILVNNAGVADLVLFSQMSEKQWDEIIEINLKGVFNCTKAAISHMINQRSGKIINTTSPAAIVGAYAMTHYAAAKGGIISFTRSLAREVDTE
jgi:3-oxoacyl-[acyl-carrier protein] reductase